MSRPIFYCYCSETRVTITKPASRSSSLILCRTGQLHFLHFFGRPRIDFLLDHIRGQFLSRSSLHFWWRVQQPKAFVSQFVCTFSQFLSLLPVFLIWSLMMWPSLVTSLSWPTQPFYLYFYNWKQIHSKNSLKIRIRKTCIKESILKKKQSPKMKILSGVKGCTRANRTRTFVFFFGHDIVLKKLAINLIHTVTSMKQ